MGLSLCTARGRFVLGFDKAVRAGLALTCRLDPFAPWLAQSLRRCLLVIWWLVLRAPVHVRFWLRSYWHDLVRRPRVGHRLVAPLRSPARWWPRRPGLGLGAPETTVRDAASVVMPFVVDPVVSVIVPTFGKMGLTLDCLASIAALPPAVQIEVIVVDDAWPGPELDNLAQVRGIRLMRNEFNVGFLHSCNLALQMARGRYLYFLNNDTRVLPDWLDPMLALFLIDPDVGAVGAKLLSPDGRLQAAGGLVWRDGSSGYFGCGDDPAKPIYNAVREVDYCPAAAMMIERAVFARLGGFDERFAPTSFEAIDLCFRLRREGLKVLYQPAAVVVHAGGSTQATVGSKSSQTVNRQLFLREWGAVLARRHDPVNARMSRVRSWVTGAIHQPPMPSRSLRIARCLRSWLDRSR